MAKHHVWEQAIKVGAGQHVHGDPLSADLSFRDNGKRPFAIDNLYYCVGIHFHANFVSARSGVVSHAKRSLVHWESRKSSQTALTEAIDKMLEIDRRLQEGVASGELDKTSTLSVDTYQNGYMLTEREGLEKIYALAVQAETDVISELRKNGIDQFQRHEVLIKFMKMPDNSLSVPSWRNSVINRVLRPR